MFCPALLLALCAAIQGSEPNDVWVQAASSAATVHGALHGPPMVGYESIDSFLLEFVKSNGLRGACLVVARNDRPVYFRGTGYSLSQEDRALTADSKVPIASVTKFLTACATMHLIQQGKLSLDARFLDRLPARLVGNQRLGDHRWKSITIRQLLSMSAGLPDYVAWKDVDKIKTRRDYYSQILSRSLSHDPGSKQAYNNNNFAILGDVIAEVAEEDWRSYTLSRVLREYGVTSFPTYASIGYKDSSPNTWDSGAAGDSALSPLELARIVTKFSTTKGEKPLSLQARSAMVAQPIVGANRGWYGFGVAGLEERKSGLTFAHGGALTNAHTFFRRMKDGTVVVGFYCGELSGDIDGSGQWTMERLALEALKKVQVPG